MYNFVGKLSVFYLFGYIKFVNKFMFNFEHFFNIYNLS